MTTRFIFLLAAIVASLGFAQARPGPDSNYNVSAASAASYVGPCDVSACTAAYGFFSGTAAYATAHSPAIDLCDVASCSVLVTINYLSTGYWDAATAAASASCAVSCWVTKFYDSSGHGADAPVTGGTRAVVAFNSLGSCSAAVSSSGGIYLSSTFTSVPSPWSLVGVGERTGSFTSEGYVVGAVGAASLGFSNAVNTARFDGGSGLTLSVTDSAYHAFVGLSGASGSLNVDSLTPTTGNAGTNSLTAVELMSDSFGNRLIGNLVFGALMPSSVTPSTMNANLHAKCGGW